MDEIYLDEFHFLVDSIKDRRRRRMLEQSQLHMLPNMDEEGIQQFFESLESDKTHEVKTKESSVEDIQNAMNQIKRFEQGVVS